MEKHKKSKFKKDPRDYDIKIQWIDRDTKFVAFPVRTPTVLKKGILQLTEGKKKSGSCLIEIGSVYRFVDWINDEMETDTDSRASKETDRCEWSASDNIEHACDIAVNGEKEIIDYVQKESKRILLETKNLESADYGVRRDVEGMYLDVGLYMSGEPEAFFNSAEELIPDRCLDVHIQAVYSANVNSEHVKDQIKNLVAAIASLELSGYRVAVHVWWCSETNIGYPNSFMSKCVKEHRQPINIPLLVGITHPAFMRRLEFRVQELVGSDCSGYGSSIEHEGHYYPEELFYLSKKLGTVEEIIKKLKEMKIETT